jgi:pyridoxal phosphate enzyme (YggS family)
VTERSEPTDIATNLNDVRSRIDRAARGAGRDPHAVTLVAVSKTVPVHAITSALACGQHDFGENRAQELVAKAQELRSHEPAPVWHFVGRLQRNKVRALAPFVATWHSVDRAELGPLLARHAPGARVFVQVDIGGEPQKGGCEPDAAPALVDELRTHGLAVVGLMTVPPAAADPRPVFVALRELAGSLGLSELSMGMTGDFEIAIAEGATVVRVGTAVFGGRRAAAGPQR